MTIDAERMKRQPCAGGSGLSGARSPAEHRDVEKRFAERGGHIPAAIKFRVDCRHGPQRGPAPCAKICKSGLRKIGHHRRQGHPSPTAQTHHVQASLTAAKILGYPRIRAYAGSCPNGATSLTFPIER